MTVGTNKNLNVLKCSDKKNAKRNSEKSYGKRATLQKHNEKLLRHVKRREVKELSTF